MKKMMATILCMLMCCVLCGAPSAWAENEMFFGHSVGTINRPTAIFGIVADVGPKYKGECALPLRAGLGYFGKTHYVNLMLEKEVAGNFFAGVGAGWVTEHEALDNHFQFTTTAGYRWEEFVFRVTHISNAANLFQHGDERAKQANKGVSFATVGVGF